MALRGDLLERVRRHVGRSVESFRAFRRWGLVRSGVASALARSAPQRFGALLQATTAQVCARFMDSGALFRCWWLYAPSNRMASRWNPLGVSIQRFGVSKADCSLHVGADSL